MKTKIIYAATLLLLIAQSCTYKLNTVKYDKNVALKKNDLFYHLPKTTLILTLKYKVVEETPIENGIPQTPTTEYSIESAELKTATINDPEQLYIARGKNISNKFFLKENVDFKFNERGIIQSVETSFEDKTLESAESLLKGASSILQAIALAGSGTDAYLQDLSKKITAAYKSLAQAIAAGNAVDIKKYKEQLKDYLELLKNYLDNNKKIRTESQKTYTLYIDPDRMAVTSGKKVLTFKPISIMPEVKLEIDMNTILDNRTALLSTGDKDKKNGYYLIPGLVYAIPTHLRTRVVTSSGAGSDQPIIECGLDYCQYGNLGFVPVASKLFTTRKTTLEFNSSTGALTSYKTESGSSSENLGKAVENNAALLKTTLKEIKYDNKIEALKQQKELKELKETLLDKPQSQADSLKTELELLKTKLDLKKIQAEIDNLNK